MAKKFEEAMIELEGIVRALDRGEATLDESLSLFEKGVNLADYCQKLLDNAEEKISMITFKDDNYAIVDFSKSGSASGTDTEDNN